MSNLKPIKSVFKGGLWKLMFLSLSDTIVRSELRRIYLNQEISPRWGWLL